MSVSQPNAGLKLPSSLKIQLDEFRRRVWTIKSIEAACGALFGVFVSYLIVFGLDRVMDTPAAARTAIFLVAVAGCAYVPIYLHRWIWCHRRLEQLARLLSRRYPSIGDQMLGVIELVRNEFEQNRSRALCEAAIEQVAEVARKRDFTDAVPNPRHRQWAWMAAVPAAAALLVLAVFPSAASNAWARFAAPWRPTPRYTFTNVEKLAERVIVPHGEATTLPRRSSSTPSSSRRPLRSGPVKPRARNTRSACNSRVVPSIGVNVGPCSPDPTSTSWISSERTAPDSSPRNADVVTA